MPISPHLRLLTTFRARKLEELVREYADHQNWRCEWQDRWPWEPDCPCGLTADLRELGLPVEWAYPVVMESTNPKPPKCVLWDSGRNCGSGSGGNQDSGSGWASKLRLGPGRKLRLGLGLKTNTRARARAVSDQLCRVHKALGLPTPARRGGPADVLPRDSDEEY